MPFQTCYYPILFLYATFLLTASAAPADTQITQPSLIISNGLLLPYSSVVNGSNGLNVTSLGKEVGYKYHVPHSSTTLELFWGFPADWRSLSETISAAKGLVEAAIDDGEQGSIPTSRDPFEEDLGYGVCILCSSDT